MTEADSDFFYQLELYLLHADFQERQEDLELLLDPQFVEIGADGRVNSRCDVIKWLLEKKSSLRWELSELYATPLADSLVQVRYRAIRKLKTKTDDDKTNNHTDNNASNTAKAVVRARQTDAISTSARLKSQGSLHTSIWRKSSPPSADSRNLPALKVSDNCAQAEKEQFNPGWSMLFHQATRISEP